MYKKKIFYLLVCVLLWSCESVVDLYQDETPQPTLNCLLCPDSSRVRVDLNYSTKISSQPFFVPEEKAQISLVEEESLVAQAQFDSEYKCYYITYRVKSSCKYQVIVNLPSARQLKGETQIPAPPEQSDIHIDTTRHSYRITNRWYNQSGGIQYYWIYSYGRWLGSSEYRLHNLGCTNSLIDPFNVDIDSDFNPPMQYEGYMRIENKNTDPISVTYTFSKDNDEVWAHLMSVDQHYDFYLKAYISNKLYREEVYELPLLYEPSYTYSNVEGGVGIVGSYCGKCEKYQNKPEDFL